MPSTARQDLFREWARGTLLYALVMGFFDDYTNLLRIDSFSILFLAALVMQALTYATLSLKKRTAAWFESRPGKTNVAALGISIWAIMFLSKFVFLEVLDIIFGASVEVSGFVGLVLIIAAMLAVEWLIERVDRSLADGEDTVARSSTPQS